MRGALFHLGQRFEALPSNACQRTRGKRAMTIILLIILLIILVGALPTWPYSSGWGYYPSGGLGLILVIVLVLYLAGYF
jgi:hypothetical protein